MKLTKIGARRGASHRARHRRRLGIAGQAHAAAFYLQEQSTVAIGRAFSGEVSEQGAAAAVVEPGRDRRHFAASRIMSA